jgi:hypothetical protein
MSMKVLAAFKTSRNAAWFANNGNALWHERGFGSAKR